MKNIKKIQKKIHKNNKEVINSSYLKALRVRIDSMEMEIIKLKDVINHRDSTIQNSNRLLKLLSKAMENAVESNKKGES